VHSKNKRAMSAREREHVNTVKQMDCGVCGAAGPSDAHELNQGQWFTSIPLCKDCHQGGLNGWHGQRRIWNVLKKDELSVLNDTVERMLYS
jgi:hypothetical protein